MPFARIELSSLLLSLPSTERKCKLVMPVTLTTKGDTLQPPRPEQSPSWPQAPLTAQASILTSPSFSKPSQSQACTTRVTKVQFSSVHPPFCLNHELNCLGFSWTEPKLNWTVLNWFSQFSSVQEPVQTTEPYVKLKFIHFLENKYPTIYNIWDVVCGMIIKVA